MTMQKFPHGGLKPENIAAFLSSNAIFETSPPRGEADLILSRDIPAADLPISPPAKPIKQTMKLQAHVARLPQLKQRIAELEKDIEALKTREQA